MMRRMIALRTLWTFDDEKLIALLSLGLLLTRRHGG
jgi:hypothetical protein